MPFSHESLSLFDCDEIRHITVAYNMGLVPWWDGNLSCCSYGCEYVAYVSTGRETWFRWCPRQMYWIVCTPCGEYRDGAGFYRYDALFDREDTVDEQIDEGGA